MTRLPDRKTSSELSAMSCHDVLMANIFTKASYTTQLAINKNTDNTPTNRNIVRGLGFVGSDIIASD
ncbi:MAG: hypothetical protein WC793_03485 [Candidatus Paceibacterota bacterium]